MQFKNMYFWEEFENFICEMDKETTIP